MPHYTGRWRAALATLAGAVLLQGQAADKGLFMPETVPPLSTRDLAGLVGKTYPEIAWFVLRRFTEGVMADATLRALCEDAYDYDVPLERVDGRRFLMRLDRGPTALFKDFAARMMARWMSVLMGEGEGDLVILTATSGDTGSARGARVPRRAAGAERRSLPGGGGLEPPAEADDDPLRER